MPEVTGSSDDPRPGVTGENVVAALTGPGDVPLFPAVLGFDCYGVFGTTILGTAGVAGQGGDNGVYGTTANAKGSGVYGENDGGGFGIAGRSNEPGGVGVLGEGQRLAGLFNGDVEVLRDLIVHGELRFTGGDLAEQFRAHGSGDIVPGSVLVIADAEALELSSRPYDRRVAGVVSNAGSHRPAAVLSWDRRQTDQVRVALSGKVYCRVDARLAPIAIGDLLTTSATPGCAMKVVDWSRAFGATIGKALAPMASGEGIIPILATLQ